MSQSHAPVPFEAASALTINPNSQRQHQRCSNFSTRHLAHNQEPIMSFRYSVFVTFPSAALKDAYIAWLRGGHMSQVSLSL
jgi:hypothetical protein